MNYTTTKSKSCIPFKLLMVMPFALVANLLLLSYQFKQFKTTPTTMVSGMCGFKLPKVKLKGANKPFFERVVKFSDCENDFEKFVFRLASSESNYFKSKNKGINTKDVFDPYGITYGLFQIQPVYFKKLKGWEQPSLYGKKYTESEQVLVLKACINMYEGITEKYLRLSCAQLAEKLNKIQNTGDVKITKWGVYGTMHFSPSYYTLLNLLQGGVGYSNGWTNSKKKLVQYSHLDREYNSLGNLK